jgi:nucleoside-diphosphate-sugar epimerase
MPRVLIAGCGYVGSVTADLFLLGGNWNVEGWTHSHESASQLSHKPYLVRSLDLTSADKIRMAAQEFDVVIHCASSRGGDAESYRRIYFRGTQNLIESLHPGVFVFTSSTSVYAQTNGEWVDEESAADPLHERGRILRETEELVRRNGGTVARLAGIYGPGRSALLRKFLVGDGRIDSARVVNQVHRDDAAAALFLLATSPGEKRDVASKIFNVVDDQPLTQRECYEWLAAKLGRPIPNLIGTPIARKRGTGNKRVSNQKLRALGWRPKFPTFQVGMERSVLPASANSA